MQLPVIPDRIESRLKNQARSIGFDLVGIAAATESDGFARFREWLDRGYGGEMGYLERHADAHRHPKSMLPEVRSVLMLGYRYSAGIASRSADASPTGCVAAYARGEDYHDVLRAKLKMLSEWVRVEIPGCRTRGVVDTAPLLERDFARRAGLGWFGKNTMLIDKKQGSFFFLAGLLLDVELARDPPHESSHCGSCTRCLDACPTKAFNGPGWLDARKCISYLTIELKSSIPSNLREEIGDWLFGCDVCQDVCPWNRKQLAADPRTDSGLERIDLIELCSMSEIEFERRFGHTPMSRPGWRGIIRNALIVLGNVGDDRAFPGISLHIASTDEMIRESAIWAIDRVRSRM